ncbi:MAG: glycosyltransferase family 2 protein [Chromatiales bacterium]|nr:glycosyltransferase family 2 protein [Chromatiales bacterium]
MNQKYDQLLTPNLSVVVPVYRSQETLHELHRRLAAALEPIDPHFELILVEDCGGDDSWSVIEKLAKEDGRVRGIQLNRNFGQHAATICGFAHAQGQWIATLDDDLEQAPEYLPKLYRKALEGHDLVYGIYPERTHRSWRNITSATARWLFSRAIPSLNHAYTSYRMIRGDVARALTQFDSPFPL